MGRSIAKYMLEFVLNVNMMRSSMSAMKKTAMKKCSHMFRDAGHTSNKR